MSNERSSSKSGLFLIELIISIVFFAVASAICTQLFVQAHLISSRSNDLNIASTIAQNCAEEFKAKDHSEGGTLAEVGASPIEVFSYYDQKGLPLTGAGQATYLLSSTVDYSAAPLTSAQIQVYKVATATSEARDRGEPLFALQVVDYNVNNT